MRDELDPVARENALAMYHEAKRMLKDDITERVRKITDQYPCELTLELIEWKGD